MPSAGFEPATPPSDLPQTLALGRSATGYALHRQVLRLLVGPQNVSVRAKPSELTSGLFETPAPESLQTR